ncbi:MAG: hypothetical protein ACHP9T_08350 [Caulobacterales bacterium]
MRYKGPAVALSALAFLLGACGGGVRGKGSAAIAGFLDMAKRGDPKAFEAAIDRPALRSDLRQQIADVGRRHSVDVGGASEFALDRMITPQAARLTAARVEPGWPAAPTAAQIVPHMKVLDGTHICLEEAATRRCLLSFAQEDGAWRLVGMAFTPPPADGPPGPAADAAAPTG